MGGLPRVILLRISPSLHFLAMLCRHRPKALFYLVHLYASHTVGTLQFQLSCKVLEDACAGLNLGKSALALKSLGQAIMKHIFLLIPLIAFRSISVCAILATSINFNLTRVSLSYITASNTSVIGHHGSRRKRPGPCLAFQ